MSEDGKFANNALIIALGGNDSDAILESERRDLAKQFRKAQLHKYNVAYAINDNPLGRLTSSCEPFLEQEPDLIILVTYIPPKATKTVPPLDDFSIAENAELAKAFVEETLQPLRETGTRVVLMSVHAEKQTGIFTAEWMSKYADNPNGEVLELYRDDRLQDVVTALKYDRKPSVEPGQISGEPVIVPSKHIG